MSEQEVLQAIVERMRQTFEVKRIVLFGSRARGDSSPDSDYDVLVEVDSNTMYWERQRQGYGAFGARDWSMDLIVKNPEEMERSRRMMGSIVRAAEMEGQVIYER